MTTWFEQAYSAMRRRLIILRRKLPYLVWWDDEIDVTVTLSQDKLDQSRGIEQLFSGSFAEVEKILGESGIGFDTGVGPCGRDWEWDYSLRGPISIRFRSRAKRPERRMERPRPKLVFDRDNAA